MKHTQIKQMILGALFVAIGLVLPFFTGQIPAVGRMLLPMHIPVLLCGLICGWKYGLAVGAVLPLTRSLLFGMPILYPTAIAMTFELATYGLIVGLMYGVSRWKCVKALYISLLTAMVAGRVVWGIAQALLLGLGENGFTVHAFISGAVLTAFPGIILQLTLIPLVMFLLDKTHLVPFRRHENVDCYAG